jgi:phosphohistidine phosphatase SixA
MSHIRTGLLNVVLVFLLSLPPSFARAQGEAWAVLRAGGVALLRHAAPNREHDTQILLQSEDCLGQRWLSDIGQAQATVMGEHFRREGINVARVLTSPLCPARATAEALGLAAPEVYRGLFVATTDRSVWSTRAADVLRRLIADWRGPGALVLVTHLGNIAMLTGVAVDPGEGFVLQAEGSGVRLVGRLSQD